MKSAAQHLLDRVEEQAVTIHNLRRDLKNMDRQYHALINLRHAKMGEACFETADGHRFFATPPYMPRTIGDRVAFPFRMERPRTISDGNITDTFNVKRRMYEYRGHDCEFGPILEEVVEP